MKRLNISQALNDINDRFVEEAAEMPLATAPVNVRSQRGRFARFTQWLNGPVGVAMVCGLVAVAVVVGIVAAGRATGPVVTPPNVGVSLDGDTTAAENLTHTEQDTEAQVNTHPNFDFSYALDTHSAIPAGTTVNITNTITNTGAPFVTKGSSQSFSAEAKLVPHGAHDPNHAEGIIYGMYAYTDDYIEMTIPTGMTSKHTGQFIIPADAAVGWYDLYLCYRDEYQVFEKAVSIYSDGTFDFSLQISVEDATVPPEGEMTFTAGMKNVGPAFTYEGSPGEFYPSAVFIHRETGYRIIPSSDLIFLDIIQSNTVETGAERKVTYSAHIPKRAHLGTYDLYLSYGEAVQIFTNVLTVTDTEELPPLDTTIPTGFTISQAQAWEIADAHFRAMELPIEHDRFEASIFTHTSEYGSKYEYHMVVYSLKLYWMSTGYHITVVISPDGEVRDCDVLGWKESFATVTDEDVATAIARMGTPDGDYYFVERDGKLHIYVMTNESITQPAYGEETEKMVWHRVEYEEAVLPPSAPTVTTAEEALEVAAAYLQAGKALYVPIEHWTPEVSQAADGDFEIIYTLWLGGIPTDYMLHVTISPHGEMARYVAFGTNSLYGVYSHADVEAAVSRMGCSDSAEYYFVIEQDVSFNVNREALYVCAAEIIDGERVIRKEKVVSQ